MSLKSILAPGNDSSAREFRISGIAFLVLAVLIGFILVIATIKLNLMNIMQVIIILPAIIWFIGIHRLLWGGVTTDNQAYNIGKAIFTAVVGFVSLAAIGGVVGAVIGYLKNSI